MRFCLLSAVCHGYRIVAARVPTAQVHRLGSPATPRHRIAVISIQCKATADNEDDVRRKVPWRHTAGSRKRAGNDTRPEHQGVRPSKQAGGTGDASRVGLNQSSGEGSIQGRSLHGSRPHHQYRNQQVLAPQKLTYCIKQATTPQQLLQLVQQYDQQFNYIHLSAAITRLGQWQKKKQMTAGDKQMTKQLLSKLEQLLLSSNHLQLIETRGLSNIIWSCSLLGYTKTPLYSRCLQEFMNKLPFAKSLQDVSNVLYGLAESGERVTQQQFDAILAVASRKALLQQGTTQGISNIIWSAAKLSMCVSEQDLQYLVACLISKLADAKPQHVSNVLWAVATMQQSLLQQQVQSLLACFCGRLAIAKAQEVSNTLWGVAAMQHNIPDQQLQQVSNSLIGKLAGAKPQDVSNSLWACGQFSFLPQRLLNALLEQQLWQALVPALDAGEMGQVAVALGALGHKDDQLMAALLQQALGRMQQHVERDCCTYGVTRRTYSSRSSNAIDVQLVCNLCWSVAVLDMQQHIRSVQTLVQFCAAHFKHCKQQGLQQLQQVHLWLRDVDQSGATGLNGVLSDDQLLQCRTAWDEVLQRIATKDNSKFQKDVFETLNELPFTWCVSPAMEQLCEPDGLFSIDISGVTADGVRLAIEVDGPYHFRRPDYGLTGATQFRNRALAARGYVVVSVPYNVWDQQKGWQDKQQYLKDLLQQQTVSHRG